MSEKLSNKKTASTAIEAVEDNKEIIAPQNESVKQIENWIEVRQNFIKNVVSIMVEGKDYHKLNFRGKEVQVLAKGGAEKVASALGWTAEFLKDTETYEMLGSPAGTLCYVCNLKNGEFKGQGRGARSIKQDGGDINKAIKMAQKSAFIDAVLRASGLSDLFTQDLEEAPKDEPQYTHGGDLVEKPTHKKPSERQAKLIKDLAIQKRLSQTQLAEMAKGKTPSELIDSLFKYIPQETFTQHFDKEGEVQDGPLPEVDPIAQELDF